MNRKSKVYIRMLNNMKELLVIAVLILSTLADFDDELDRTLCGYSIEKKQKIWDCIKLDYPALIAWEQCMSYLGVHTGGEFLNNNCGPSDVPLEYRESFSKCIESRIKSENVKQKSEEEERDMFRQCIEELD